MRQRALLQTLDANKVAPLLLEGALRELPAMHQHMPTNFLQPNHAAVTSEAFFAGRPELIQPQDYSLPILRQG